MSSPTSRPVVYEEININGEDSSNSAREEETPLYDDPDRRQRESGMYSSIGDMDVPPGLNEPEYATYDEVNISDMAAPKIVDAKQQPPPPPLPRGHPSASTESDVTGSRNDANNGDTIP